MDGRLFSTRGVSTLRNPGFVYFIQGADGGPIKIGWATRPAVRMAQMQAHSPVDLRLLHTEPGNGREERELHARFAAARKHGEWFWPADELLAFIEARKGCNEPKEYQPAVEAPYVLKGRKPPPVNYGSVASRRAAKAARANVTS
jgi:hypothetical protein